MPRTNPARRLAVQTLHAAGYDDGAIGRALGITPGHVHQYRKAIGLAAQHGRVDQEAVRRHHAANLSDAQIAAEIGCSALTVFRLLKKMKLKSNNTGRRLPSGKSNERLAAIEAMRSAGKTWREIGEALGMSATGAQSFARRRKR